MVPSRFTPHIIAAGVATLLAGCPDNEGKAPETMTTEEPATQPAAAPETEETAELSLGELVDEKGGIKISKLEGSPEFPDAKLSLTSPKMGAEVPKDAVLEFEVEGYELGAQTVPDPFLANSAKGQHIHVIVDNAPYTAHYDPNAEVDLEPGSHVILAFLSRSYHESVKHDFVVTRVHHEKKTKAIEEADLGGPHLFYSRPKGTYTGDATERVLLDFYLVNTSIAEDGNKVEATINGETFTLTEWVPYVVEGLKMGENTFALRLVDAEGNLVPGPFNEVERTITLKEG
jgi:hypothetical protein